MIVNYAFTLETSRDIGTSLADKTEESGISLRQSLQNTIPNSSDIKLDLSVPIGQTRVVDTQLFGYQHLRILVIKSSQKFGYSFENTGVWLVGRAILLDFGTRTQQSEVTSTNTFTLPKIIRVQNIIVPTQPQIIEVRLVAFNQTP